MVTEKEGTTLLGLHGYNVEENLNISKIRRQKWKFEHFYLYFCTKSQIYFSYAWKSKSRKKKKL